MFQKMLNKLNDLRPKQLLMLAGAAGVLMFAAILIGVNLMSKEEAAPPPEDTPLVAMTKVVVAKVNIPPRTRIQESMLQMKEVPADLVPEGAIDNFDEVKNVQIKVSIFAGDILTIQKVFNETGDEGFVGAIPADCRAVSISVNDLTGVAGFAKPGDKVDLLFVEKGDYSATTDLLLQNVPILSINQDMTGSNLISSDGAVTTAISNPTIATFALPLQDIVKLISASRLGEIYMVLRPSNPQANYVEEIKFTIDSVNTPPPKQEPVREPPPAIPSAPAPDVPQLPTTPYEPPVPKIEIIQGDEITQAADTPTPVATLAESELPIIPSGNFEFTVPPVPSPPIVDPPSNN